MNREGTLLEPGAAEKAGAGGTRRPGRIAVAYFSMEIGLESSIPTYAGGLGVLAGDTLRAAADLGISMAGVTLVHRKGYFRQRLDAAGNQTEEPQPWSPEKALAPTGATASVRIEGRQVEITAWRYDLVGVHGDVVPVYLLDSDLAGNARWDRSLTDQLYGGDSRYRLCQEALLGYGGVAILRALGQSGEEVYHLNEGHASFLALALLEERMGERGLGAASASDVEAVRQRCVFTTHTPVPAGHDEFPVRLAREVLGEERNTALARLGCCPAGVVNMTHVALRMSRYVNGVSMRHEEISRGMFPNYPINSITNGVHAVTWTAPPFQRVFDAHIPEWRTDNRYLRYGVGIPLGEIRAAHEDAKRSLLLEIERRGGPRLSASVFTIGFARRATAYKRADMLLTDPDRLRRLEEQAGRLQVIYAGKAHPRDLAGKSIIRTVFRVKDALAGTFPVVYLEDYDIDLARLICSGVDLWLNTPQMPEEASGTSGMKAALNGVPSLSVLDGWWVEGCVEGATGWAIGDSAGQSDIASETASMYDKLQQVILPLYYARPAEFAGVMRSTIAVNGSFFNAERMLSQYVRNAYARQGDGA